MLIIRTPQAFRLCKGILLIAFAIEVIFTPAVAQPAFGESASGYYAGIEVSSDGVRAVVLHCSMEGEMPNAKLIFSEALHLSIMQGDGSPAPQVVKQVDQAVKALLKRIREQWHVPEQQIYLIGTCELMPAEYQVLLEAIRTSTGKNITLLDKALDAELSISGTIPKRIREGETWIDIRNSSILIQLGATHIRMGYQRLIYLPPSPPSYKIFGTIIPSSFNDLRASLHREFEVTPSLLTRNNIYLSGDLAWAIVTLLHLGDQRSYIPLDAASINRFVKRVSVDPVGAMNPDLSKIKDLDKRQAAEREVGWIRDVFTPRQLVDAAVRLKLVAAEFNFQKKRVWYARHGDLARLMIYLRLQAEN